MSWETWYKIIVIIIRLHIYLSYVILSCFYRPFIRFFKNAFINLLISPTHVIVEKVLFGDQIFEMGILMDLYFMRSLQSENHIFSVWSFSLCVCVCYQHNSKTNNSRIIKFGILHLYHIYMLPKTLYKDRTKNLCTGAHTHTNIYIYIYIFLNPLICVILILFIHMD